MPIIGALVLLIQFSFAFHAIKRGRPYWWIFVIMAFPVMGCVIYYFVEVFPGSREHRSAHRTARMLVRALQPDADLKRRAEELEVCGSIENKMAMADECLNHQMVSEAVSLYESCLSGAYAKDGNILFKLMRATVEAEDWAKAGAVLGRLRGDAPEVRVLEVRLLEARLLNGQGQSDAALAAYRELIPIFTGLEARFRYGSLLLDLGQHEAAIHVFNEILARGKRYASPVEDERQWIDGARRAISGS